MGKVSIELPVEMWNIVLNSLGQRPYAEVFEVVAEIKKQGEAAQRAHIDPETL